MVMQANLGLGREEILEYIRSVVEVIVQLTRLPSGERIVSEIYFAHAPAEGAEVGKRRRGRPPKSTAAMNGNSAAGRPGGGV